MKNLAQSELMAVAAGISSGNANHGQSQPQAGIVDCAIKKILKFIVDRIPMETHPPYHSSKDKGLGPSP